MEFDSSNGNLAGQINENLHQANPENSFHFDPETRRGQLRIFIYGQKGVKLNFK
jgi:hypothetical protein